MAFSSQRCERTDPSRKTSKDGDGGAGRVFREQWLLQVA